MTFLPDTNVWVELLRRRHAGVLQRFLSVDPADLRLCSVVLAELIYGAYRSGPSRVTANLALVARLQQQFTSLPFDDLAADRYGQVRADLAAAGTLIGPHDLMIAAIALSRGLTVVTHNTSEFGRVAGLHIEDWQGP